MSTTNKVASTIHTGAQNLFLSLLEALGLTNVNLSDPRFRMKLEMLPDQKLFIEAHALSTDPSVNPGIALVQKTVDLNSLNGGSITGVKAVLTAGANAAIPMPNKAGDLIVARQIVSGGTPGATYSVQVVNSTTIKVLSQTAAGALQNADTSTIEVYNFGNPQF